MRAIRVYPSADDKVVLQKWFGHARKIYNDALQCMNEEKVYGFALKARFSHVEIGNGEDKRANPYFQANPFLKELPSHSRKYAVMDLLDAFKSNMEKRKKDPSHTFRMKFRSKKGPQYIRVEDGDIKLQNGRIRLYPRSELSDDGMKINAKNAVPEFRYAVVLKRDLLGRYWVLAPHASAPESQGGATRRCCAIDPGVRTFATVYDPDFGLLNAGDGASSRIHRLLLGIDDMLAKAAAWAKRKGRGHGRARVMCHKSRRRLDRAVIRARERVKNLVKEMHRKVAHLLTRQYDTIVIPPFETQTMAVRHGRKIRRKSVRQMLGLSHFAFRARLIDKAAERGVRVHVLGEEYTSKTCTACGRINDKLGGSKVFACASCGVRYDRDAGGARNIFIKNYQRVAD